MIKGIDINQRVEYTFKNDTTDPKTVFVIRPLSPTEFAGFTKVDPETKSVIVSGDAIINLLLSAVVEVRNYAIGDEEIKTTTDNSVKKSIFRSLPASELNEIFGEVISMNKLGDTERKN